VRRPERQLYHYFDDREDLLRAVAQATCETVIDIQADALAAFDSYTWNRTLP